MSKSEEFTTSTYIYYTYLPLTFQKTGRFYFLPNAYNIFSSFCKQKGGVKFATQQIHMLRELLLKWFHTNQRSLPWRQTNDPYKIWVSEIMLQQTRADTVIPYYLNFISQYSTVEALAKAGEEEVLKAWEGMGYYSRARNLHKGAQKVLELYGGRVPDSYEALLSIPGIGDYTAGAILSIAYRQDIPAVDGNVLRVASRWFAICENIGDRKVKKQIRDMISRVIPKGKAHLFNQAIMDLGALICVPRDPKCDACPVSEACRGYEAGIEKDLPVKSARKAPRNVPRLVAIIWNGKEVLMHRRPPQGLLAGLWEFPGWDIGKGRDAEKVLNQELSKLGVGRYSLVPVGSAVHVFSHIKWFMTGYCCKTEERRDFSDEYKWVEVSRINELSMPTAMAKYKSWVLENLL